MARFSRIAPLLPLAVLAASAAAQNTPPANPPPPTTAPAAARDLPEAAAVIDRAIKAHGGPEALASITSLQYVITTEQPGSTSTFRVRAAPPDKTLITIDGTTRMEFGRNGDIAWRHDAATGFALIPESQLGQVTRLHPLGLVMRLPSYRDRAVTADHATVGDHPCLKLRLPSTQGEVFLYFDDETGLVRGLEEIRANASARIALMTTFEDERAVAPLTIFHLATMSFGGQALGALKLSDVRYNTLDPELFAVPAEVAALARTSRPTTAPAGVNDQ
ncbi:MAG: hypothetical protein HKO59_00185 [Phycisphaerales bacterium]|nr:hypothetical protein [Phycisphaerales bacterium]NNM24400.1 hypothetical protein [Phycisphaerales bacterium]